MNLNSKILTLIMFCGLCFSSFSQKAIKRKSNTKPYPFGNPVITHMYTADPSPRVMPDGLVWMVTSVDHEEGGGYKKMHNYHTFSSLDMVHWTDHGEVLNIYDVIGEKEESKDEDWALWAPDMVYRNGKYYLYFPIMRWDKNRKGSTLRYMHIGVAVSDAPNKKFRIINKHIKGTNEIDPAVFINDDGKAYMFFGKHHGGELRSDMLDYIEEPKQIPLDDKFFFEASWVHKRNQKYYYSYHTLFRAPILEDNPDDMNRPKSKLDYAISDQILGPYKYKGVLNEELGVGIMNGPKFPGKSYVPWRLTQSNHGGIVEYHGQEYLFYHNSALSSWRQDEFKERGTWQQRSVCIDEVNYDAKGKLITVQQTLEGVDSVMVNQPYSIRLNSKKAILIGCKRKGKRIYVKPGKSSVSYKNVNLGTGYYYFKIDVKDVQKARVEVHLDNEKGKLLGTILIDKESYKSNNGITDTFLREANGKHNICLVIINESNEMLSFSELEFFAGKPKEFTITQTKF